MLKAGLTDAFTIVNKAYQKGYAIAHFNVNNLEWVRAILLEAMASQAPVIIATSQRLLDQLGGLKTAAQWILNFIKFYKISVPIALHLDHGDYQCCLEAIDNGYTSVMYDGSKVSFQKNLENSKNLAKLCQKQNLSLETEIGAIGGTEDGASAKVKLATVEEALAMQKAGVDLLAIGIGNIHGLYPKGWKSLDFALLAKLYEAVKMPFVLHGSSGIPLAQIKRAISFGVAKINYNTELQQAYAQGLITFVESKQVYQKRNYQPTYFNQAGEKALRSKIRQIFKDTSSFGKYPY